MVTMCVDLRLHSCPSSWRGVLVIRLRCWCVSVLLCVVMRAFQLHECFVWKTSLSFFISRELGPLASFDSGSDTGSWSAYLKSICIYQMTRRGKVIVMFMLFKMALPLLIALWTFFYLWIYHKATSSLNLIFVIGARRPISGIDKNWVIPNCTLI
jgi:hypothetical protein